MKINVKSISLGVLCALAVATTVTAQPTFATTNSCKHATFSYGVTGDCVREIQALLRGPFGTNYYQNPYTINLTIDGGFGTNTRSAVIKFQRNYGGGLAVDGVVGPHTWWALCGPVALNTYPTASWNAAYLATC